MCLSSVTSGCLTCHNMNRRIATEGTIDCLPIFRLFDMHRLSNRVIAGVEVTHGNTRVDTEVLMIEGRIVREGKVLRSSKGLWHGPGTLMSIDAST